MLLLKKWIKNSRFKKSKCNYGFFQDNKIYVIFSIFEILILNGHPDKCTTVEKKL